MDTLSFGSWGEEFAANFLQQSGLILIDKHFRQKWGEIDLICKDKETWVFVEVKSRTRASQPSALDAITGMKRQRLAKAAMSYMKMKRLEGESMRFDVVAIEEGRIRWIPDAFESPFRSTY